MAKKSDGRKNPFCPRCGRHHWNFNGCPGSRETSPTIQLRRPRDGYQDVGDRLETLTVIGSNTFGKKRPPLHEVTR